MTSLMTVLKEKVLDPIVLISWTVLIFIVALPFQVMEACHARIQRR